MLSVVVYGRNDSHGYNLHKRVAVSLNAFAEVLGDVDDEIIFVDYNTPDQLPTLPEALADTLTERARRHLRVLRVRPQHHLRFQAMTHLAVVEPVARNVGLRRANPANRWALLSNTDMILVPPPGRTLTDQLIGLADGPYHLPRFELPESLWEGFDRRDPAGFIAFLRQWGARLHLDETVLGLESAVYDNPGDFQLFPLAGLRAVNGLDERMVNGWVVDSNIALRLARHYGPSGSLADRLAGYHCSHIRQSGVFHDHTHVENDFQRFVQRVDRPELPEQGDDWGLADCLIEEVRLPVSAATPVLPAEPRPAPVSCYRPDAFDRPGYAVAHVLPYLADLVSNLPKATVFGWCGARPQMLAAFTRFCLESGRPAPVTPESGAVWRNADVFIFEFGALSDDADGSAVAWTADDLLALSPVVDGFIGLMDHEEQAVAEGRRPRWVIVANANHNRFEALVQARLAVARIPFITRLRHGYVRAAAVTGAEISAPALARWLGQKQRRQVPITEIVRLQSLLARSPHGLGEDEMAIAAHSLLPLLDHPGLDPGAQLAARIEAVRPSRRFASQFARFLAAAGEGPMRQPCRLALLEDWDDPAFLAEAMRLGEGPFAGNALRRSASMWGRVQVAAQMRALGLVRPDVVVAVIGGDDAETVELAARLSLLPVGVVQVFGAGATPPLPAGPCAWGRLAFFDGPPSGLAQVVVVVETAGWLRSSAVVAGAAAMLPPGGLLALLGRAVIDGGDADGGFDPSRRDGSVWRGGGMVPLAPPTCLLTAATIDRLGQSGTAATDCFILRRQGAWTALGGWFFRAGDDIRPAAFAAALVEGDAA
ncbi:MAG: hypothetical protein HYU59_06775 [Magnetospirillum gryphiswaldense]|nr:hypothetical protein [Magnetospirillum gryphiswaldense]